MVSAGTSVTYQAKAKNTFTQTPADIVAAVSADCELGGLRVTDNNIVDPGILAQLGGLGYYSFQMTLTVQAQMDFNSPSDIQSLIDGYILQETGSAPESSSIQGGGSTEQPQPSGAGTQNTGDWLSGIVSKLETLGQGAILGIGLLIVGIIIFLMYVPGARPVRN